MKDLKEEAKEKAPYFENETEEAMGISTVDYDNGKQVKKLTLSDGREAVVRTLYGIDAKETNRRTGGNQEDYMNAQLSVATKIDGKSTTMEDIDSLKSKDYNKILVANTSLNF